MEFHDSTDGLGGEGQVGPDTSQEVTNDMRPAETAPVQVDFSHVGTTAELDPAAINSAEYTAQLVDEAEQKELRGLRGHYHPAVPLLDQIDIASSFPSADTGHKIRELVKKVRALL